MDRTHSGFWALYPWLMKKSARDKYLRRSSRYAARDCRFMAYDFRSKRQSVEAPSDSLANRGSIEFGAPILSPDRGLVDDERPRTTFYMFCPRSEGPERLRADAHHIPLFSLPDFPILPPFIRVPHF